MNFFVHESAIADTNCTIGAGTKIWHFSHVMSGATIGEHCVLGQNVYVATTVIIGDHVKIQNNVSLYDGVICEDDVFIGPSVVFTNILNPRSFIERKNEYKKTIIKKGATIGANATILCGVTIGAYAMIGAGAVVVNDVAENSLIVGNPGKQIGWVSDNGHRLEFDENNEGICTETKQQYVLINNQVNRKK
jgi:UDP-2-acetamido-3-amino-2,3-dideoxy-glucuronate N-acetyltransferase